LLCTRFREVVHQLDGRESRAAATHPDRDGQLQLGLTPDTLPDRIQRPGTDVRIFKFLNIFAEKIGETISFLNQNKA
jgi:hypothetical protein